MSHKSHRTARNRRNRKIMLCTVGILAVLFLVLQFALGTIVRKTVVAAAPSFIGTDVTIDNIHARVFSGAVMVDGMVVGPPEGFDANVFELSKFKLDLDVLSLLLPSKPIHIREILIEEPKVVYEIKGLGNTNLKAILDKLDSAEEEEAKKPEEEKDKGRKVVIDHFSFKDGEVKIAVWDGKGGGVFLPDIELDGIGRKSGGATGLEATGQILRQISIGTIKAAAEAIGDVAGAAFSSVMDAGEVTVDAAKAVGGAIGSLFGGDKDDAPDADGKAAPEQP